MEFTKKISVGFFRPILSIVSASVIGQLFLLAILPLVTYLYTPAQLGGLAICLGVINVIAVISGLRYEVAIPLVKLNKHARLLSTIIVQFNLFFSGVALIAISVLYLLFLDPQQRHDHNAIILIPIGIFCVGMYRLVSFSLVRQSEFKVLSYSKMVQAFVNGSCQILLGYIYSSSVFLVIAFILGQATAFILMKVKCNLKLWQKNYKASLCLLKKYRRFPKYDAPAALVDTLSSQLPNLFLAIVFEPVIAGIYLLAERVVSAPMAIVSQAIGQVYYAKLTGISCAHKRQRNLLQVVTSLFILAIVFFLCFYFVATYILSILFSGEWQQVINVIKIIVVGCCFQLIYSPLSMVLMATNGQRVNFFINLSLLLFKLIALLIGWSHNNFEYFLIGFSFSNSVVYLIAIFVVMKRTKSLME